MSRFGLLKAFAVCVLVSVMLNQSYAMEAAPQAADTAKPASVATSVNSHPHGGLWQLLLKFKQEAEKQQAVRPTWIERVKAFAQTCVPRTDMTAAIPGVAAHAAAAGANQARTVQPKDENAMISTIEQNGTKQP
jgi:hypothetical protein